MSDLLNKEFEEAKLKFDEVEQKLADKTAADDLTSTEEILEKDFDKPQEKSVSEKLSDFSKDVVDTAKVAKTEFDDKIKPSLKVLWGSFKKAAKEFAADVKTETAVVKEKFDEKSKSE